MNLLKTLGRALGLAARAAPVALATLVALSVVAATVPVAAAWFTKGMLDELASPHPAWSGLAGIVGGLLAAGLIGAMQPQLSQYVQEDLGRKASLVAQDRLYRAVNRFQGLRRFEDPDFLDRLRMAQQTGQDTPNQIILTALSLVRTSITMVGFFGMLLVVGPQMAWIVVLGAVPTFVGEVRLARRRVQTTLDITGLERREMFYAQLLGDVAAAKEIRLFNLGDHLRQRMNRDRRSINGLHRRMDRWTLLTQGGLAVLAAGIAAAGLFWAVRSAVTGTLTVGDVSIFVAAVATVQTSLGTLATGLAAGHQHLLIFERYLEVVGAAPDLPLVESPQPLPPLREAIVLRDVWFRYSDDHPWILRGVDLTIAKGRAVALVGVNGAGKSTLVKLLGRFYDPTRGSILWDGIDIRNVPVEALRERLSGIFQDFMHYDLTVRDNIAFGDLAAARDEHAVTRAAERAGIHQTLAGLPSGYDTMLTRLFADDTNHAGVVLSGGQWQRVALARALVRDGRDLLILDEPSSGLDAEAEYQMHHRLREHRAGQTSLLISHRLGAVRDADAIVVLDDGVVVEQGDHDALLAADGHYARLFTMQAEGYATAGAGR
ncbi:ABC transporter ATP-binding protein [Plantactinospora sp. S1510]|uniref:ABC transporter ATP-binding protein n=1 Tax=Plantactinospora alkalitolerans TaxID=2789879 RepID=A0ABS0GY14_9ACTN|nr:ABC transporter ATP-binding protein [Plantactinospora alkalitolerans]MBF9131103.1 ABC transporter ATP-binding protein [Plantactinospora alkalitolerans]